MEVVSKTGVAFPFNGCSTFCLFGPTKCGKSTFLKRLIYEKEQMFERPPVQIMYAYGTWTKDYDEIEKECDDIVFHEGLPNMDDVKAFTDGTDHKMIILDDLLAEASASNNVDKLFTLAAHHYCLSVCFISQNIFPQGKKLRNISLNAHYIVVFKNTRDVQQITRLGSQLGSKNAFTQAYTAFTTEKYGYVLIDLTPDCPENLRWRTHIFPGEQPLVFY